MNVSYLNTQGVNNVTNLCQDPDTKGFDLQAGQSWIYPTNYPVREYQYNIIEEALHKNTLVSLPTGLGKTFIAAVVMYNFYRWYPHDKIIFMAPTRPLVKQQMDACYNIMAIPQDVTAELTGSKGQQSRTEIWQNKRVFFITPQVLQNDLNIIIELGGKIKCLVFDEAHRAKGNHAYCEVIRKLLPKNKLFRVLALSATPGNSSRDVIEVMENLLIAHVEFRSEESVDVKPYVFERALETVVVPLGEKLQEIKDRYIQILEKYTRALIQYKVIYGNCCNLTKGRIFMVMKEFQARNAGNRTPHYSEIMKSLNICVTLYHAYETLIRCGLRAFSNFYEEHINNPLLSGNVGLRQILDDLRVYLGPPAEVLPLPDGTFAPIPSTTKFGHPKFYKLRDIIMTHFNNLEASTRVIVFFEYRESASEAYTLLTQCYPLVKPRVFVGQGSGITQRDQINTVKAFREGTCNTLLSTCIGEEGLDVGDVDLIVCFDIANKSPIRMIQRMGRTGRKKEGRVVVLVTEGKEQQTLKECLIYKSNLGNFVTNCEQLEQGKYRKNPKMIPSYIKPKCEKMFITVKKPVITKSSNLKDMLRSMSAGGPKLEDVEIVEIKERLMSKTQNFWNKENPLQIQLQESKINFNKHLEKQRAFQNFGRIKQSKQTEIFVSLLQFADSKRYNIPVTQQLSTFNDFSQNKCLKQGDIRDMFSKPNPTALSQEILSSQTYNYCKEKDITPFPTELFDEISTFLSIQMETKQTCKTCDLLFECPKINEHPTERIDLSSWVQPDLSILDTITVKDLEVFADSLSPKSKELYNNELLNVDNDIFENVTFAEETAQKSFTYEIPRDFDKILDSFKVSEDNKEVENIKETSFGYQTPKSFGKILNLLGTSAKPTVAEEEVPVLNYVEILNFFKLSSLEEIFDLNESSETIIYTPDLDQRSPTKKPEISPDIFGESPDLFASEEKHNTSTPISEPGSPILCTFDRVQQLKAKKKLFTNSKNEETEPKKPNLGNLKLKRKSFFESTRSVSPRKSPKIDITDLCDLSEFGLTSTLVGGTEVKNKENPFEDDFCDLSDFGITDDVFKANRKKEENEASTSGVVNKKAEIQKDIPIDDFCDFSDFGFSQSLHDKLRNKAKNYEEKNKKKDVEHNKEKKVDSFDDFCDFANFGLDKTNKNKKKEQILPSKNEDKNKQNKDKKELSLPPKNKDKNKQNKNDKNKSQDDFDISDLCDLSVFGLPGPSQPKKDTENYSQKTTKTKEKNKTPPKELSIDDMCDISDFFDDPFFDKSGTQTQTKQKPINNNVIDLTDSPAKNNFELSPIKSKPTQINKTATQLSISQMLSLVGKTNIPPSKSDSQKENLDWTPKTQKLSLSTKKRVLQNKQNSTTPKSSQKINTATPKTQRRKFNISLAGDSDDEFEDTSNSPIFARPKPLPSSIKKKKTAKPSPRKETKKRKKLLSEFIEEEAELSESDRVVVSDDEEEQDDDCFEASFIADETQGLLNNTTMHVKYLQSVKSPVRGKFKIPEKPRFNITNVFSQEVNNEDNTYLEDSFCVDSEDCESDPNDISELDLLEMKLKEMKRHKKRKKCDEGGSTKRRRIIALDDDSD